MKFTYLFLFLVASVHSLVAAKSVVERGSRPNILFFLIDDLHYKTLGYAGDDVVETPYIDKLAAEGVQFENCFSTTSICAASRASILTGRYERGHQFTFGQPPLAEKWLRKSYSMLLREAGYTTGFIGKYGMKNAKTLPPKDVFDSFELINRTPYFKKQADGEMVHTTDLCATAAVKFITEVERTKPFCLSVSFSAVHAEDGDKKDHFPWPQSSDNLYSDVIFAAPRLSAPEIFDRHPEFLKVSENRVRYNWRWDTEEKYQKNMLGYYRMVSGIDTAIGRVLDTLKQQHLAENTVIIVMGDNGYYKGNRGLAGKWSHYEESLRIPLVIVDPRSAGAKGVTRSELTLNLDITSTMVDLGSVEISSAHQGMSLLPLMGAGAEEPSDKWREDFLCEHLMNFKTIPKWEGVRNERYIYARYFEQDPVYEYLHDLEEDPDQLVNLAKSEQHEGILAELRARCSALVAEQSPKRGD